MSIKYIPCPRCEGTGKYKEELCKKCNGLGKIKESENGFLHIVDEDDGYKD